MSNDITVKLFYADWCGHCHSFKPEWNKLKKMAGKIKTEEYEAGNNEIMEANNINGYPTIKIFKRGNSEEYRGERTADAILSYINSQRGGGDGNGSCNDPDANQCGGGKYKKTPRMSENEYYKMKYLKYKAKYMHLLAKR